MAAKSLDQQGKTDEGLNSARERVALGRRNTAVIRLCLRRYSSFRN